MSTLLLEKDNNTASLNPSFFALFAKSCYLKKYGNEDAHYNNAKDALIDWAIYCDQNIELWEVITDVDGVDSDGVFSAWAGFQAVAYKNTSTKEIIIAYRGTDSLLDVIYSDAQIAFNLTPQQVNPAIQFYDSIYNNFQDEGYTISITGHSLGGTLAQYVAAQKQVSAVTFNAPGVSMPTGGNASGIINYVNMNDFIGCLNPHLGETRYYLPDGIYLDDEFKPHSDYINQDFSKYVTLPSGVNWSHEHAFALWGYDVNNTDMIQKGLLNERVKPSKLKEAISILQEYFKDTDVIEQAFVFNVPTDNVLTNLIGKRDVYAIGTSEGETFSGKNGEDVIFANGGDDNITGGKGDDILIGGTGSDEIYGDSGNDILIAGETTLTVEQLEALRNNYNNIDLSKFPTSTGYDNYEYNSLYGGDGDDLLIGVTGNDYLDGGNGDDVLISRGNDSRYLSGGKGYDVYRIINSSSSVITLMDSSQPEITVNDDEGQGALIYEGIKYAGTCNPPIAQGLWVDAMGNRYEWSGTAGDTLTINGNIKVEGFKNHDLGITLNDFPDDTLQKIDPLVLDLDGDGVEFKMCA